MKFLREIDRFIIFRANKKKKERGLEIYREHLFNDIEMMNMKNGFIYGCLLLISSLYAGAQEKADWEFQFPLNIKPAVSGSFGEIRGNHFHSGLDLSTRGKTGLPVFAADSGFVSRIAVSPVGFGKAVYIDHPSGYTTVYAHLQRFNDKIDSVVTALQYRNESFALQHYFEPEDFPVKRGEIIAWSGNSGGSGGPHLHFEVRRTRDERPIDPLAFPTPVKDDVRPQIKGVMLYPLSSGGTINGQGSPQYFPVVFYNKQFHLKGNPVIESSGVIGVGIEVLDYYTGSWRKCGIHSIRLKADNQLAFQFVMKGFLFSQTRYLNSHIDYAEKMTRGRIIQKSFLDPFNLLDLYQTNSDKGRIIIKPGGSGVLDYEVRDISGNTSRLVFKVKGAALLQPAAMEQPLQRASFIQAGKACVLESEDFSVAFGKDCFYKDVPACFKTESCEQFFGGRAISVLDETVPLHTSFELKLPLDTSMNVSGITGALMGHSGKLMAAGGEIKGTHFVVRARRAGVYGLTRDTVPPKIRLVGSPANLNYRGRKSIVVHVEDDFSGIAYFRCRINGKWALFGYDPKTSRLEGFLNKVPSLKKGDNKLEILIRDNVKNEKQFVTIFKY